MTAVDFVAQVLDGELPTVELFAGAVEVQGEVFTGFSEFDSIYLDIRAHWQAPHTGTITILVEESSDGIAWNEAASASFTTSDQALMEVPAPLDQLKVTCTSTGKWRWAKVTATPTIANAPAAGLNDLTDVDTAGGSDGDVLTQQVDGSFAPETPAGGASDALLSRRITFTETAGAGVYTGTVTIPAGGVIHNVGYLCAFGWIATTALLSAGYTGVPNAFFTNDDVRSSGNYSGYPLFGYNSAEIYSPAGTDVIVTITTTGAGGAQGLTDVVVVYSVPPAATAATKA